jgi:hypothetical protein
MQNYSRDQTVRNLKTAGFLTLVLVSIFLRILLFGGVCAGAIALWRWVF